MTTPPEPSDSTPPGLAGAQPEPTDVATRPDWNGLATHPDDDPYAAAIAPVATEHLVAERAKSGLTGSLLLGLAALVAVGGVAFAGGRLTAPTTAAPITRTNGGAFPGGQGPGGLPGDAAGQGGGFRGGLPGGGGDDNGGLGERGGFGRGGLAISGTVTAIGNGTITITTSTGARATIATSSSTTYHRQSAASASDITPGATVSVRLGFGGVGGPSASPAAGGNGGARQAPGATDVTITTP